MSEVFFEANTLNYFLAWNLFAFLLMFYDKYASQRYLARVPEKYLFILAFLIGAAGIYLGMKVFRHKTLKPKFKYGLPALVLFNAFIIYFLIYFLAASGY